MLVVSTYFRSLTLRYNYRIITIKIKLDVVFLRFMGFSITITLRQKLKGVTRMLRWITRQRRESMRFCLRVIVNEKILNLEKTTSSVLSVLLLIDGYNLHLIFHGVNHQIHYFNVQCILLTNQQSVNGNPDKTGIYQWKLNHMNP